MKASANYCVGDKLQERRAETMAALEGAARTAGYALSADGRVSEADAAALLGLAPKTLRNWRLKDGVLTKLQAIAILTRANNAWGDNFRRAARDC